MICCLFEDVQIREGNIVTRRRDFWYICGEFPRDVTRKP
jgi:hypothetical protein